MSKFTVSLKGPDYLIQWLRHEYWNPETSRIEFPRGSAPRVVLQTFLRKAPKDYQPVPDAKALPIEVPTIKGVNPASLNYLPECGRAALVSTCKKLFQNLVWSELHERFTQDVQITDIIYAFMERHGIENDPRNWEAIRQIYARLRKRTTSGKQLTHVKYR